MNPDDEALGELIDKGSQVVRMIAVMRFDSSVTVELPSGRILAGNEIPEWVERVARQRLAGPRVEPAVTTGYQGYADAVARYVAGTGTLTEVTDTITPEVAERISVNEHETAKRRESDRATEAWAAACDARNKHRHVKHAVALVGAHKLMSFVISLIVALIVVPWSVWGIDSDATGMGVFMAYVLVCVAGAAWAVRSIPR